MIRKEGAAARGFDSRSAHPVTPSLPSGDYASGMKRESVTCDVVAMFRGVLAARRDPAYGALDVSDDQIRELANALASNLLATFSVAEIRE